MFEKRKRDHKEVESVFSLINIIFLLIVFFIVAGHVSDDSFEVNPPEAKEVQSLTTSTDCTIQILDNTAFYNGQKISNNPDVLKKISDNCQHKTMLIADKQLSAIQIVSVLNQINHYFDQIDLLVMSEQ